MARGSTRLIVLTGGPGSGKSTLLDALATAGHAIAPEAGRAVIRQQMAIDGPALPWQDRAAFAEAMLAWDLRSYEEQTGRVSPVFFDRGIPDVAKYLSLCGLPIPRHISRACAVFRYDPLVFVAPPWREIYANDAERRQDWDEAVRTHAVMVDTYRGLGYETVDLPRTDVMGRAAFVLHHL
ncbi:AAA family ATPase [Xanthobacter aminoxidans]|uniref:AAA family ATPase n=1 Tax=Xanthobacter aminoxidans TaxID=186280 RepID=UPI00202301CF|nr:AAA family ATPase [Xanthobacter aminoxidans]MCL8385287.1 AAA family ATPase [Xanthobacter aminoxidans]